MTADDFAAAFLDLGTVRAALPILLSGLWRTLALAALAVPLGLAGGLALALLSRARSRGVRLAAAAWTDVFRALPPLVLLVLLYAGLPFAGLDLGPWGSVALAFFLNGGAYYGEILRAGLDAVPPGQAEAARALGLSPARALRLVLLPQAARNVLPDLLSNTLEVVKLTSLASVVALPELLFQARQAQAATYNASPVVAAALAYLVLLWPLVRLLSRLEHRSLGPAAR